MPVVERAEGVRWAIGEEIGMGSRGGGIYIGGGTLIIIVILLIIFL